MEISTAELEGEDRLCQANWDHTGPDTGGLERNGQSFCTLLALASLAIILFASPLSGFLHVTVFPARRIEPDCCI